MKKSILLLVCLLVANLGHGQKKNIIKLNMISPVLGAFHLSYEAVLKEKVTLQLGLMYFTDINLFGSSNSSDPDISGFAITPEIRFYPKGNAPVGFFLAASPRYQYYQSNSSSLFFYKDKSTASSIGLGLVVGNQWVFSEVISLEIFGGPSVNKWSTTYTSTDPNGISNPEETGFTRSPIGFRFGVNLGYAF